MGNMKNRTVSCKQCRKLFPASRSDAVTCSPRCRQAYKRFCDSITAQVEEFERAKRERKNANASDAAAIRNGTQ